MRYIALFAALAIAAITSSCGRGETVYRFEGKSVKCSSLVAESCGAHLRACHDGREYLCVQNLEIED